MGVRVVGLKEIFDSVPSFGHVDPHLRQSYSAPGQAVYSDLNLNHYGQVLQIEHRTDPRNNLLGVEGPVCEHINTVLLGRSLAWWRTR